jgi:hypothetical protein
VTAGAGLSGGGTSGNVTLNVNTGNAATTGLEVVSDELRLSTAGCVAGEVLKRNSSNTGWECVADNSGGASYSAGEGITISGTTISISAPTTALKGGVKAKACAAGQAVTGIDTSGNPVCQGVTMAVPPGMWYTMADTSGKKSCESLCSTYGKRSEKDPNTPSTTAGQNAICRAGGTNSDFSYGYKVTMKTYSSINYYYCFAHTEVFIGECYCVEI